MYRNSDSVKTVAYISRNNTTKKFPGNASI